MSSCRAVVSGVTTMTKRVEQMKKKSQNELGVVGVNPEIY